jgi:hypothetical protein
VLNVSSSTYLPRIIYAKIKFQGPIFYSVVFLSCLILAGDAAAVLRCRLSFAVNILAMKSINNGAATFLLF